MKNILAVYFSGTGNTLYAVKKICDCFMEKNINCRLFNIENEVDPQSFNDADVIIIAYPIHSSFMPFIMKDFIKNNAFLFKDKKIITIVTQMIFSGDGGALVSRLLKNKNVQIISSLHINLSANFAIKSEDINLKIYQDKIKKANLKIIGAIDKISKGQKIKNGRRFFSRFLGFIQRTPHRPIIKRLRRRIRINQSCIKCNKCTELCPINNILLENNELVTKDICTLCHRCVNSCPTKAIGLFTKKGPKKQYKGINNE